MTVLLRSAYRSNHIHTPITTDNESKDQQIIKKSTEQNIVQLAYFHISISIHTS